MGQMAVGILYGVEAPELPTDEDNEEPDYDLLCRWEKAQKITWDSQRGKPCIRIESEGGKSLWGVWIAVGGSGEDGVPHFLDECLPLNYVPVAFAKQISRAAKLWGRFAAWCEKKEGIKLPLPKLWLTPCETA